SEGALASSARMFFAADSSKCLLATAPSNLSSDFFCTGRNFAARVRFASRSLQPLNLTLDLTRYLQGPGTGITSLPSFSATKLVLLLVELPLASFCSTLIVSFFVGFRLRHIFPPRPS